MDPTGVLSYQDLEARWKAKGKTPQARNRWIRRRCVALGLKPMPAFGRGTNARFRFADVLRQEEKSAESLVSRRRRS